MHVCDHECRCGKRERERVRERERERERMIESETENSLTKKKEGFPGKCGGRAKKKQSGKIL